MTTEGDVAPDLLTELTPEQQAAEDAAFEAGFAAVTGDEPEAAAATSKNPADDASDPEKGQPAVDDSAEREAQAAADAERQAVEAANAPITITKGQFDRLMTIADEVPNLRDRISRSHDTVAGRLGSIQQTIDKLKEGAGRGNTASIKQLTRLEKEFPELATLLKEDLSDAFGSAGAAEQQQHNDAPLQATQAVNPLEIPEVRQALNAAQVQIVETVHPGFQDLAETPEFAQWKATLPAAAVNLLSSSWDSKVMVPAFNDFKKWKQQRDAATATKQQNDKRLERGIAPTDGAARSGQHVVDEDAAFEEGFKSVRNR